MINRIVQLTDKDDEVVLEISLELNSGETFARFITGERKTDLGEGALDLFIRELQMLRAKMPNAPLTPEQLNEIERAKREKTIADINKSRLSWLRPF